MVKVLDVDRQGKIRLSRRASAVPNDASEPEPPTDRIEAEGRDVTCTKKAS